MTRPNHRLPALTIALAALLLLAGCSVPVGSQVGSPTGEVPAVEAFPGFPTELTDNNVGPYVAAFEEAYRHNFILSSAEGVTSISVGCNADSVTAIDEGFEVTVDCGFGWMFEQDGAVGVADGRPYEATYRVSSGGLTERVGSTL